MYYAIHNDDCLMWHGEAANEDQAFAQCGDELGIDLEQAKALHVEPAELAGQWLRMDNGWVNIHDPETWIDLDYELPAAFEGLAGVTPDDVAKLVQLWEARNGGRARACIEGMQANRNDGNSAPSTGWRWFLEQYQQGFVVDVVVHGVAYIATVARDDVSIDAGGRWAGDGVWSGARIDDCAADLPDAACDALDAAIAAYLA